MEIKYHNYFYKALQLHFKDYLDKLKLYQEVYLAEEPLHMDYLLVKKMDETKIDLDLAQIFEKYNIIEFKSPDDYISIDDYYKALSYVYYYKATEIVEGKKKRNVDDIKISEITLTLFSSHYPQKLIKHLKSSGKNIEKKKTGLFLIKGEVIPIQLINGSKIGNIKENYSLIPFTKNKSLDKATQLILNRYNDNSNIKGLIEFLSHKYPKELMEVTYLKNNKVEEEAVKYIFDKMEKDGFEPYLEVLEKGKRKGRKEGELKEARKIILKLITKKFSHVPDDINTKLKEKNEKELETIAEKIIEIDSLQELKQYLYDEI